MLQKIEAYIRQHHMINAGSHVIIGVSGGADSICLLLVLLQLRERLGHTVSVVHVEHGIRGQEALEDAEFVRHFCEEKSIECHICHCLAPEYAHAHGMSEEEAGRHLRYAFFEAEKRKYRDRLKFKAENHKYRDRLELKNDGADVKNDGINIKNDGADIKDDGADIKKDGADIKIAVAHNLGDQAETMLFHLARGTGISGLAGIAPVRGDIIRPLLMISRSEIEQYLEANAQAFRIDATNESQRYSRNKIRGSVMTAFTQVNSRAAQHMYETAQQLREIDAYLKKQAEKGLEACCTRQENGVKIDKELFEQEEPVLQKQMLHGLLSEISGSGKDITRGHVSQVRELFAKQNGRRLNLPYGMCAVRVYGGVEIFQKQHTGQKPEEGQERRASEEVQDGTCGNKKQPGCGNGQFSFRVIENFSKNIIQISKKKYTKCFDYDKIKNGFCVRNRLPGDYLAVDDSGSRQKLKKYLVNEKIPAKEREQLLLLADGSHIMWVVGWRISSYYKVDEHTRRILEVTFYGGKEDE